MTKAWIWELTFENQPTIYIKGKKSEILNKCFPEKPTRMTKIYQKEFERILNCGVKRD